MSKVDRNLSQKKFADRLIESPKAHAEYLKTLPEVEDAYAVQYEIVIKIKEIGTVEWRPELNR